MLNDKYNYNLNGIEHEIILNNTLKIDQQPLNNKILVSNKYMIKYINDLFTYNSIEYCFINNTLLGIYIFNGVNIFNGNIELCISESNLLKLKKIEDDIKSDDFDIKFYEKYIRLSTIFFDNIKVYAYIYLLDDLLKYHTQTSKEYAHEFYDIYPIKKSKFEEFEVSVPNKIEKVLETYNFNIDYIIFSKNKSKQIIEEVEDNSILNKFISIIKPFLP